jgi:DNA-binding CsgD family transcriptional regulator
MEIQPVGAGGVAAVALSQAVPLPRYRHSRYLLTPREFESLALYSDGWTAREIATAIGTKTDTTSQYIARSSMKLRMTGRRLARFGSLLPLPAHHRRKGGST